MPIIFSSFVPHSPLLVPTIGKENTSRLKQTIESYNRLEENLYVSQPDTIIIISPHGTINSESFTINLQPEFNINFEEFGDFATKIKLSGDIGLAHRIRERLETRAPVQLLSDPLLDHGSSIPLYLLTKHLPKVKIIPLYYSGLDLEAHFKFGRLLKREFLVNKNRVAIVASGDLSHRLNRQSPAGYSPKGKKFDQKLIKYILSDKPESIIKMNPDFISEASECGLKSVVILLGILDGFKYQPKLLSYETPFGIGYLTMEFRL